jgi:BON domain
MRTRQRGWGWIATGLLTAATLSIAVRPAGAQGFSGSSSGGGFSGSSGGGFSGSSGGGFTGSSGGGFSGSSSGMGFTGSSGSFSGSSGSFSGTSGSFSGTSTGSYTGTSRSSTGSGGSGTNVVPQASDPFQTYYANPYKFGMSTTTGTGTSRTSGQFGTPLYGNITTPKTTTGTTSGGTTASMSFNTVGMRRAPSFTTTLGFAPAAAPPPSAMQIALGTVYQGTSQLSPNSNIQVVVNGGIVVLRGRVANENERRVAEGMARLEPGVREVRNELIIAAPRAATP